MTAKRNLIYVEVQAGEWAAPHHSSQASSQKGSRRASAAAGSKFSAGKMALKAQAWVGIQEELFKVAIASA
jgi:hypothetical protein